MASTMQKNKEPFGPLFSSLPESLFDRPEDLFVVVSVQKSFCPCFCFFLGQRNNFFDATSIVAAAFSILSCSDTVSIKEILPRFLTVQS